MNYEYTPLYYGTPCQVKYWDIDEDKYVGGICLRDELICGCCGSICKIDEMIAAGVAHGKHWDDVIIELEWKDINENILT
jgi:hypothetical protein